jgi:hypothetical protein
VLLAPKNMMGLAGFSPEWRPRNNQWNNPFKMVAFLLYLQIVEKLPE